MMNAHRRTMVFSPPFHYHWLDLPVGMCITRNNHRTSTLVIILISVILLQNLQVYIRHHR
jgi:hypothetical protein